MPAGPALAIDRVQPPYLSTVCRSDYLQIWGHTYTATSKQNDSRCYANRGVANLPASFWMDQISTGNNDIVYTDANGTKVNIARWRNLKFTNEPHVTKIEIL